MRTPGRGAPALALTLLLWGAWASAAPASDVLKAKRPKGGEYFGLYLVDKKVGYLYEDLAPEPGHPERVRATTEFVFKATVGAQVAERRHKEQRTYEARPSGRLLSFVIEDTGDGGNQKLTGSAGPAGLTVHRERPGFSDETMKLPPSHETVEDADQARVALFRRAKVEGLQLDGTDLGEYRTTTTVGPTEERVIGGVKVRLHQVVTISDKDKVPMEGWISDDGALLEVSYGRSMRAQAEPASIAQRLDQVEIFTLTRVPLPTPLPDDVRRVPGQVKLVVQGLPERFAHDTYRQKFKKLEGDRTEVTLLASAPAATALRPRPLSAPGGEAYLKSTMAVESNAPAIRKLAGEIVQSEHDAYSAAKRIVSWVGAHMEKGYGTSADRATDVLRQMKGDCTEHSLLSVALLRAAGIPARRVDGLVYVVNGDHVPALYWHEWVEAYVGEWTQLDPTFGEPVADATHFAVGEESGAEITPLLGQLKVLEVLSR